MADLFLVLNGLLLVVMLGCQRRPLHCGGQHLWTTWRQHHPRRWQAPSPHDCPHCQAGLGLQLMRPNPDLLPYSACKSPRGRKKRGPTDGLACPNADGASGGITGQTVQAWVGYGRDQGIQRLTRQAGGQVCSRRIHTPLDSLKSSPKAIEFGLWFLAQGVDASVPVRFPGHADATLARWLERMGTHSQAWHNPWFRNRVFTVVQLAELSTRVRQTAAACWLWLALDPASQAIPSLHLGCRTKTDAFALVHDRKSRLAPDWVPAFTPDGLRSYFYARTAHVGHCFRPPRARTDHWHPRDDRLYRQLVKRKNKRHLTFTHTRMLWSQRRRLFARLRPVGLRPLLQTAFVERLNLTFRQAVSALSRRTWAYAQTERHLLLPCDWFRLYSQLIRAHESLSLDVPGLKRRYRSRSPAMALGLTTLRWCVHDRRPDPLPPVL